MEERKILVARTAGFCFGVKRAVEKVYEQVNMGKQNIYTYGPIIHNEEVVTDLEKKGVRVLENEQELKNLMEGTVVIRSHGVPKEIYEVIEEKGLECVDATCPFVAKIHKIAMRADENHALLLVAGDASHPEVQGIVGHTKGKVKVFANLEELEKTLPELLQQKSIYVVAQTTFRVESWEKCKEFLKKQCTKAEIFDTICNATWARQQEAEDLSQKCDHMVVIGGHHSSNTQKLLQVAARHAVAINVETADELDPAWLKDAVTVGVTAGASTPSSIIEEVLNSMSEEIRDDMSFEEMLAASEAKPLYAGKIVKAKVISVSPTECVVGIDGSKHTGVVTLREMSHDPNAKMEDLVKVDDDLDLVVIKTNDQEGVDTLSRVRFEAQKGMKDVSEAAENGTAAAPAAGAGAAGNPVRGVSFRNRIWQPGETLWNQAHAEGGRTCVLLYRAICGVLLEERGGILDPCNLRWPVPGRYPGTFALRVRQAHSEGARQRVLRVLRHLWQVCRCYGHLLGKRLYPTYGKLFAGRAFHRPAVHCWIPVPARYATHVGG